jgi:DNA sulfur modification protein DndB
MAANPSISMVGENVKMHYYETMEEARLRASEASADVSGFTFPCIYFKQGRRIILSGALTIGFIGARLQTASAPRRGNVAAAQNSMNRPLDDPHAEVIADYIVKNYNGKYILPPVTLNVQQKIDVFTTNLTSDLKPAVVLLPLTTSLSVTDGQHRKKAIEIALQKLSMDDAQYFQHDSIAAMIVCESDIKQIHQDFADCSKTKALSPSQLAVYDRRNPANALVLQIAETCPLFKEKIDATSKTLGKKALSLFLTNQVRQLVKELLVGSYAEPDDTFQANAIRLLKGTDQPDFQERFKWCVEYINVVTEAIPTLRQVAAIDTKTQLSKIPQLRAEGWICLTATGLNIIGRIGHALFTDQNPSWKAVAKKLGDIDWRREAPEWQGNIVQNGKLVTQQGALRAAYKSVAKKLGVDQQSELNLHADKTAKASA